MSTLTDPLLMNAFNTVNLAAACILTSTTFAEELGIPKEKWIYVLGGAGTQDQNDCMPSFSPPHLLTPSYLYSLTRRHRADIKYACSLEPTKLPFKSGH